jgi:hypothetical protein
MAKHKTYQEQLGISEDTLKLDFRWPQPGDRAFQRNQDWRANAPLEKGGQTRLVLMAEGYKMGADAMVREASGDSYRSAALVFPILFNYRHFIELSIKYTIATYGPTVGINPIWNGHELIPLWNTLLEVFDAYGTDDPDEADKIVGAIIEEFAKLDPRSINNRYPVDTRGNKIELTQEEVDLEALRGVMESVANFFTGADGYLDDLKGAGP